MFKLFLFVAFLAFAAAAPAPAPAPGDGELLTFSNAYGFPIIAGGALVYPKSYPSPILLNRPPSYAHFPLIYKTGYY